MYPVIEKHTDENSLMGAAFKNKYNSHYVVTDRQGVCVKEESEGDFVFNEIVIPQEAQIVPAFIFDIAVESLNAVNWKRDLPSALPIGLDLNQVSLEESTTL